MFIIKGFDADGAETGTLTVERDQVGAAVQALVEGTRRMPWASSSGISINVITVSVSVIPAAFAVSVSGEEPSFETTMFFADRADADAFIADIAPAYTVHLEGLMA